MVSALQRSRIAFLAAALLLLKAAMPWVASHAAELRGVAMVEVCSVYGVTMVPVDTGAGSHPDDASPEHGGAHHCNLSSLGAWVPPTLGDSFPVDLSAGTGHGAVASLDGVPHDACARWMAHLQHAPPLLT